MRPRANAAGLEKVCNDATPSVRLESGRLCSHLGEQLTGLLELLAEHCLLLLCLRGKPEGAGGRCEHRQHIVQRGLHHQSLGSQEAFADAAPANALAYASGESHHAREK